MARYSASLLDEEEKLLQELNKLSDWIKTNARKPTNIHFKKNQYRIFRQICGRLKEHAICDNNVEKVDPDNSTYNGIPIVLVGVTPQKEKPVQGLVYGEG